MEPDYSTAPCEDDGAPAPGLLLKNVHNLYRAQFRHWFAITAPTSLLAAFVLLLADQRIRDMSRSVPHGVLQYQFQMIAGVMVLRFGSFFVSWLLGCFALAAIATAVSGLDSEDDAVWRHDSHQRAREHFGELLLAGLITFCVFLVGMALAEVVQLAAARLVGWSHFSRFIYVATVVGIAVVASIVSWLGAAIPLILRGDYTVRAALKKSVELSSGYEGALFLLVVESLAGSYLAWYATYHGLRLLFPQHLRYTDWYGWVVYVVGVLAAAATEPPIFIGFSLVADPEQLKRSSLPVSEQTT